jgi:hypothetical protein
MSSAPLIKGEVMKSRIRYTSLFLAAMAVQAQAQSVSPAWNAYRKQQLQGTAQPASQAQTQTQIEPPQTPAAVAPAPQLTSTQRESEQPVLRSTRHGRSDAPRSAFFLGVQTGQGWIYEDIKQDLTGLNAGFRWQAGAVTQVGIEAAYGRLKEAENTTTYWDPFWAQNFTISSTYPEVHYVSLGANARFNFGSGSPVFGIARLGYFRTEVDRVGDNGSQIVSGAYAGLGLGVDVTRYFNINLIYSSYIYSEDSYYDYDGREYSINRADTATLGLEVRF